MAEFVLYRKYRPKSFKEVLGQDHIVKTLSASIANDKLSHAYLFVGTRGTGKTSIARILANEIKTSPNDIHEFDAASNGGIDEIRTILDGIRTLPFESDKKVYIIDEVHMLSKPAFNALLKSLEEPPPHVIFILATTELHKVLDTVISRCQVFNFKKPSHAILREMVGRVSKKEGFQIEDGASDLIALLGDGSFRDTHGILQKVISSTSGAKISLKAVEEITGAPSSVAVDEMISAILNKNLSEAMTITRRASGENTDIRLFIKMVIHGIRLILLLKFAPEMRRDILGEMSENSAKFISDSGNHKGVVALPGVLRELLMAYEETRWSYIGELPLELALMKILGQG